MVVELESTGHSVILRCEEHRFGQDMTVIPGKLFCVMPKQLKTTHIGFLQHIPRLSPKLCLPKLSLRRRKQRMGQKGKNIKSEDSIESCFHVGGGEQCFGVLPVK
jgi:hypothetical protein